MEQGFVSKSCCLVMDLLLLLLFFLCLRAVYLVRHKQTQMRFAMKKMNKQLMLHRNQVIRYGVKKKNSS